MLFFVAREIHKATNVTSLLLFFFQQLAYIEALNTFRSGRERQSSEISDIPQPTYRQQLTNMIASMIYA